MVLGPQRHERVSWEDAVELGGRVVKAVIDRWGPDAVGMKFFDHGGGGGGFENNWAVGRLFFSGIGTRTASIHNRPAYNSEVHAAGDAGLAPLTNAYLDARLADTIVIAGANPYETQTNYFLDHMAPNLQGATLGSKRAAFGTEPVEPARMIIIDPRRTMTVATAEAAGGADRVMHLDIEPGTDIALLNAIARVILDQRWHDVDFLRRHCEWQTFESYQRSTLQADRPAGEIVADAARLCGIAPDRIREAARWIAAPKQGGYRRRTLLHYEKGLIWGTEELREHRRNRGTRTPRRQHRQARDRDQPAGRPPGRATSGRRIRAAGPRSTSTNRCAGARRRSSGSAAAIPCSPPCGPRRWSGR